MPLEKYEIKQRITVKKALQELLEREATHSNNAIIPVKLGKNVNADQVWIENIHLHQTSAIGVFEILEGALGRNISYHFINGKIELFKRDIKDKYYQTRGCGFAGYSKMNYCGDYPTVLMKARQIILPEVNIEETDVKDVLNYLQGKIKKHDTFEQRPSKRGMNIVYLPILKKGQERSIKIKKLRKKNVSVIDVLEATCQQSGGRLQLCQHDYAILLVERVPSDRKISSYTFQDSGGLKYSFEICIAIDDRNIEGSITKTEHGNAQNIDTSTFSGWTDDGATLDIQFNEPANFNLPSKDKGEMDLDLHIFQPDRATLKLTKTRQKYQLAIPWSYRLHDSKKGHYWEDGERIFEGKQMALKDTEKPVR